MRFMEEAKRLIRMNSVTVNGNEEIAGAVSVLMQDCGLKVQTQHVLHSNEELSKRQFNVIGTLGDPLVDRKIKKGLLLNTHLDTVGTGLKDNWTETGGDPFAATVKDGKIFGLGTADVKLDFLCKLFAIEKFREKKLKQPVYLVGTCGEELGMFGAKYLIKSGALNPKFVVVGEPSSLRVVYAHKSLNLYKVSLGYQQVFRDSRGFNRKVALQVFGKSAHGSYPHLGVNAIHQLYILMQKAADAGFEIRHTRLDGGETVNKVPDRASVEFYLTSNQFEDFKRFLRDWSQASEHRIEVEMGGVGETGIRFLPDNVFDCASDIVDFFRSIGLDFEKVTDPTYDPAFSTVNLGKMRQGMSSIDFWFDLRVLPDLVVEDIDSHIKYGIQKISQLYPQLNVSVVKERMNPGLNTPVASELVTACKDAMTAAGIEPLLDKKATSTEAAQYFAAGYDSVVFGPGISHGNSHSPNEHNLLDHLEKATRFYEKLIERVCL